MLEIKTNFLRKESEIETKNCVVDKVIKLSGAEFDFFSKNLMRDWDFIAENIPDRVVDAEGRYHCLLVVGEDRRDGILVNSEGSSYARYSAFIPNAEDMITVGRYPALAELNKKLTDLVDYIAQPNGPSQSIDIKVLEEKFGVNLMYDNEFSLVDGNTLISTVSAMLDARPEITEVEFAPNALLIYYNTDSLERTEDLTDPKLSVTDMYAYGYSYIGMNPLGKEKALELLQKGYEIFKLYEDDAEAVVMSPEEIEEFGGMFGISNPEWDTPEQADPPFQVFILNRQKNDGGELVGNWLTLPTDAETLREHLESIDVDRPSEGAFTVTAVRMPMKDILQYYVTKYDSIDELNMLASYLGDMEDYEVDKFKAILKSGVTDIGYGTAALINLLDEDNFNAVELIDAINTFELGQYHGEEKPFEMNFTDFGEKIAKEEKGAFTDVGYLYNKYEQEPEYVGIVPDDYKVVGKALEGLHQKSAARDKLDKKMSVIEEIRASRKSQEKPKDNDVPKHNKKKGDPDL